MGAEARPVLTDEQWHRLSTYGAAAHLPADTWIFCAGDDVADMILVESGRVTIVRPSTADDSEAIVARYGPREFTGELNLLTRQSAYLSASACPRHRRPEPRRVTQEILPSMGARGSQQQASIGAHRFRDSEEEKSPQVIDTAPAAGRRQPGSARFPGRPGINPAVTRRRPAVHRGGAR